MRFCVAFLVSAMAVVATQAQAPQKPVARPSRPAPRPTPTPTPTPTPEPAWVIAERACEAKDIQACFDLARMHWQGKVPGWIDLDKGMEAHQRAVAIDKEKAVASQQRACEAGNAAGCTDLGWMYADGAGVPKDEAKAATLFQKSCDAADALGCLFLGLSYDTGAGVAKDEAKAAQLYQKACDGGEMTGCYDLGVMYANGQGVAKDEAKAAAFHQKACDGRFAWSCAKLGFMYEKGQGVAKDEDKAVEILWTACNGGSTDACNHLHQCGAGEPARCGALARFYEKACDGADAGACANLGAMCADGKVVAKDYGKAVLLFQKACDGRYTQGCAKLGEMYAKGEGVEKDNAKAAAIHQKACDGGYARSCVSLGDLRARGVGVESFTKGRDMALQLFEKACAMKNDVGCLLKACDGDKALACAKQYAEGEGVSKDKIKAEQLYEMACDGGDMRGCSELGYTNILPGGDDAKAVELLQRACDAGEGFGCRWLGFLYRAGVGVEKDEAKGLKLAEKACDGGESSGCLDLANTYENVKKDKEKAKEYRQKTTWLYRKNCDGGDVEACSWLVHEVCKSGDPGACLELKTRVARLNEAEGRRKVALEERACDRGVASSCGSLAFRYCLGAGGLFQDKAKAEQLFRKACELGDHTVCGMTGDACRQR